MAVSPARSASLAKAAALPVTEHESHRAVHVTQAAVQFDFYIPQPIWNDEAVQAFLAHLETIETGATIIENTAGVWQGEREATHVYRVILRADELETGEVRAALRHAVGELLSDLARRGEGAQEAFLFTETPLRATLSALA